MRNFILSHVCDVKVRVDYTAREFSALQRQFPGYLNPLYREIRFESHEHCAAVDRQMSREMSCSFIQILNGVSHEKLIEMLQDMNKRPLLFEEMLAVVEEYAGLMSYMGALAFGSVRVDPVYKQRFVPIVRQYTSKGLGLDLFWTVDSLLPAHQILVTDRVAS